MAESMRSKIGTFYVSTDMTLRTIRTDPNTYDSLLRKSIFIAISWLQRYILLSDSFYNKIVEFISNFGFNMDTNIILMRYCSILINTSDLKPILQTHMKLKFYDIKSNKLFITELSPNKYLITVPIIHNKHTDLIPISELVV